MLSCRMGKSFCDRDKQVLAPGDQNARAGIHVFPWLIFVLLFSFCSFVCLFFLFFFSSPAVVSAYHRMLFFPQEELSALHLQGILLMLC